MNENMECVVGDGFDTVSSWVVGHAGAQVFTYVQLFCVIYISWLVIGFLGFLSANAQTVNLPDFSLILLLL